MPEENQVDVELESSDEGPLQDDAAESVKGDSESAPVSSGDGTTAEASTPEVNWQEKYGQDQAKWSESYREQQSKLQQAEDRVAYYDKIEADKVVALMKDRENWVETLSDPDEATKVIGHLVQQALNQRDSASNAKDVKIAARLAGDDLKAFALNEAGMDENQYAAFAQRNSTWVVDAGEPNGGHWEMFTGYSPKDALELGIKVLKGENHEHFAKQVQASANQQADERSKKVLANRVPSATSAGGKAKVDPLEAEIGPDPESSGLNFM